jgi:phage terminase large subunit-like protein
MRINDKIRYQHDGEWFDGEIIEHAYWVQEDAYWISYKDNDGIKRIVIAYESDLVMDGNNISCTCGIMSIGGGFHSNWCDRFIAGIRCN